MNMRMVSTLILLLGTADSLQSQMAGDIVPGSSIYHAGWIDLNKNGVMDPYEDRSLDIEQRIDDLLRRMTVEEKTCQMATLYGFGRVLKDELPTETWKTEIWKDGIANIDEHLNGLDRPVTKTQYSWPPSKHVKAMHDVQRFFVEDTRLGIPVDFTNEGIRGICYEGGTLFPSQLGVGATWDIDLVSRIGTVTGREGRASGYTNIYSPILDLARDPRWGRTVECYGEDPYHVSRLGVAQVLALQAEGLVSTPKHFAVYSVPKGGRDGQARTDPHVAPREVELLYLAPFKAAFTEGKALGTMSSYNDYDGIPVTGSNEFLIEKLRREWGFKGYVVSDSRAVEYLFTKHHVASDPKDAVRQSVMAGLNVRTEFTPPDDFILPLRELVREGAIPMDTLDSRVRDVLRVKFILGLFDDPFFADPSAADTIISHAAHRAVALEAARKSIVLVKNEANILPLRKDVGSILVTGPNAAATNYALSRYGPAKVPVVSVLDGIRTKLGQKTDIRYAMGCDVVDNDWPESEIMPTTPSAEEQQMIEEAVEAARGVDIAVVVLGDDERIVGESKSRTSLDLPGHQERLLEAIYATGTPTVVVLVNGRPMTINWIQKHINGIVVAWYGGQYSGTAVADVLFGDVNPSGKLPITFPKTVGQIPLNFPYKPASDIGDPTGIRGVLYPFGHGLSYTTFDYSDLRVDPAMSDLTDPITVSCVIRNTGKTKGDEIVQLYVNDVTSSVTTYEKNLRGFRRISLEPGEAEEIRFTLSEDDLSLIDRSGVRSVEPGAFTVMVGSSSDDIRLRQEFAVTEARRSTP